MNIQLNQSDECNIQCIGSLMGFNVTEDILSVAREDLVEDVVTPLSLSLPDYTGLLQQVCQVSIQKLEFNSRYNTVK